MKRTRAGLLVSLANKNDDKNQSSLLDENEPKSKLTAMTILRPVVYSDLINETSENTALGSSTWFNNINASGNKQNSDNSVSSFLFAGLDEPELSLPGPIIPSEIPNRQDDVSFIQTTLLSNSSSHILEDSQDRHPYCESVTDRTTELNETHLVELNPIASSTFNERNEMLHPEYNTTSSPEFANTNCLVLNPETGLFETHPVEDNTDIVPEEIKNKRSYNQSLRLHGKEYHGILRTDSTVTEVKKPQRQLRAVRCSHGGIQLSERSFMCGVVDDQARRDIFKYFWSLSSWEAKKAYVSGSVTVRDIIKRRATTNTSDNNTDAVKQSAGYDCFLPKADGVKVKVCRELFLATLDIKKDSFSDWIKTKINQRPEIDQMASNVNVVINNVPAQLPAKAYKSASVTEWLDQLAKVPSHYCRAMSSRIYVDDALQSKKKMHDEYVAYCVTKSLPFVQRKKFCEILESNKISIYKPRKDQCDTCISFKEGNLDEDAYNTHLAKKDEAREAKNQAIASASSEHLVCTMDLQSVQLCPKLLVSSQYYKQKLQLHIFTIYINNTKDVHLYAWHEGDGGVTANEFVSCITSFIESYASKPFNRFTLISDGCGYQNRNKVLSSALADISKAKSIEIQQIILEKGHTMMEVDSVHSTLEKCFKPPLYAPVDYINSMRKARPTQPYIIRQLDYTFFKDYEKVPSNYMSIRPGKRTGDPTVNDIRSLMYKNGETYYKLRHTDQEWALIPQRRKADFDMQAQCMYDSPIKIEKSKFNSLQSLKCFMHRDYHAFYDNLTS